MATYTTSTSGVYIGWENTGSIGTLIPGEISELYVKAFVSTSTVDTKYKIISGSLPDDLILTHDGLICGIVKSNQLVDSEITTSSFTIEVVDNNSNSLIQGDFSLTVNQTTSTKFTSFFFKQLATKEKRAQYKNFINNRSIFTEELLYRNSDVNFGTIKDPTLVIDFGINLMSLENYIAVLSKNFYRRRFLLNSIESAVSKDSNGNIIYDIIYANVSDYNTLNFQSVSKEITYNGIKYYPSSIENMRSRILDVTTSTSSLNPKFTTTIQTGDSVPPGYRAFVPICFTQPGKSSKIIRNIVNSGFSFNLLDFDIDRVYVKNFNTDGNKYLLLNRNPGIS